MKRRNFKSPTYQPRPNPIALALCKLGNLRVKRMRNKKVYNRQIERRIAHV
jgi:tRNA (Thr-GGU) A37 N-methylase